MTVSTTAVISMVMVMIVVATALAFFATASASFTAQAVDQGLDLFFGCLAVFHDMSFEMQFLASQRMVQVDLHRIICDIQYLSEEALTVFVLKG